MRNKVGSYEAKTHLPRLLARVERGERITITRHGVPIAMLVPVDGRQRVDADAVIEKIKAFRRNHTLGGASIRALIEEGRKY
jgi:prevent-host-death family protein